MDPKTGTMILSYNYKDRDGLTKVSPPGDQPLDNSQILWHQFDFLAKELGLTKPYKLTEIIAWDIVNPNVLAIKPLVKEHELVEFPQGSDEYLCAASRKVCKAKFFLVHQHKDDFGDNDIARMKILGGDLPDRIELMKYCIEPLRK